MTLSIMAEHYYAECCFCLVLRMLSVTCRPFMLSVYAECNNTECCYAECRYAECRDT
jgi:hypothetical protein